MSRVPLFYGGEGHSPKHSGRRQTADRRVEIRVDRRVPPRKERRSWWRYAVPIGIVVALCVLAGAYTLLSRRAPRVEVTPGLIETGVNASLGGTRIFPENNPWNQRIDSWPVDSQSTEYIRVMGADRPLHGDFGGGRFGGALAGIPYVVVDGSHVRRQHVSFGYAAESDDVEYPIPEDPPIELGDDHHIVIVDRESWKLYELFLTYREPGGTWSAGSGAVFDLKSNAQRPAGWTSADAAGLPILPGLLRVDEVYGLKEIRHALRFTARYTADSYRPPARHSAGSNNHTLLLPPMGLRLRLKSTIDPASFPPGARVIVLALQRYGMLLADNGGAWFVTGTADARWSRRDRNALARLRGRDFEVVAER